MGKEVVEVRAIEPYQTELFNKVNNEYFDIILPNLMQHYLLKPAKGSLEFREYSDTPYHIHILNGLIPVVSLLESDYIKQNKIQYPNLEKYIKIFYIGFTLHDLNKLIDVKDLKSAIEKGLVEECRKLKIDEFLPNWENFIEEIKYLILGTEEGTKNYSLPLNIAERELLNEMSEYTQLADKISSIQFDDCEDFYKKLQKLLFKGYKRFGEHIQTSYLSINRNIHTLLSRKLLKIVSNYIIDEKRQKIIFYLKDGIVFTGNPLNTQDIEIIKDKLNNPLRGTDFYITSTKMDSQQIDFGFLDMMPIDKNVLIEVCEYYIKNKINSIFYIQNEKNIKERIINLFDDLEIPLTIKTKENKIFVALEKEWNDLDKLDKKLLLSLCMQKIKFLKLKDNEKWKYDFTTIEERNIDIENRPSRVTLCTLNYMMKELENKELDEIYESLLEEICNFFNSKSNPIETNEIMNDFVDINLRGNFKTDMNLIDKKIENPPKKDNMCLVCGNYASIEANESVCFGFTARGFNNKCVNTLRNDKTFICDLCFIETLLRKNSYPKSQNSNVCIYIDVGDYFINIDRNNFVKLMQRLLGEKILKNPRNLTIEIQKIDFNFDFHTLLFYQIGQNTKSNYFFIRRILNMIRETGFKIYVTDIMTPFAYKKEMFYAENVLPVVKELRWNKLRIDEIENIIEEIELLSKIWGNQQISCLLDYSKEKMSIFSYFSKLNRKDKYFNSTKSRLHNFVKKEKEVFKLEKMEKIVERAVEIKTLRYGESGSQETWMIREALDILKLGVKEGKNKETIVSQIAGALYKKMRTESYVGINSIQEFSNAIYENLFEDEWKQKIPKPQRLKHWIYQFAFLYRARSDEKWEEIKKLKEKKEGEKK